VISKIFIAAISPLGTCFVLVVLGMILVRMRHRRYGYGAVATGLVWLLVWSLPYPSFWLCAVVERTYPQQSIAAYAKVDAIVVLGGGMQGRRSDVVKRPELMQAADRYWFAAQLYRADRAPWIVVAAGSDPADGQIEADAAAEFLRDLAVPTTALLLDRQSRNTWENAVYSEDLLRRHELRTLLLVTSALHMPRALATFRKRGMDAIPAPADFSAPPSGPWQQRWLPSADALATSGRAMKEIVGLWAYRFGGMA